MQGESPPMLFSPCPKPENHLLAVTSPGHGLHGYDAVLKAHRNYWQKFKTPAQPTENDARPTMGEKLQESFDIILVIPKGPKPEDKVFSECYRQHVLGVLAMSVLLRNIITPQMTITDATKTKNLAFAPDMAWISGAPEHGLHAAQESNPHLPPILEGEGEQEQWYRSNTLYLRQVRPPKPTDTFLLYLMEHEINWDPSTASTFYPYLPSRNS